jgi:cytochrome c553
VKNLGLSLLLVGGALVGCAADPSVSGTGGAGTGGATGSGGTTVDAGTGGTAPTPDAGSGGAAGSDGGSSDVLDGGGDGPVFDPLMPMLLSQTGLYADITKDMIAPGVLPFTPTYPLWSDMASKRRWVSLPAGLKINTSDMNFWLYPTGTKLWKEFTRDGKRIETRLLMKRGIADWFMMAYKWNAAQTEAEAVPKGEVNSNGTQHDIPTQEACGNCHSAMVDIVLGFSALQLAHDTSMPGLNLDQLKTMNVLSAPPAGAVTLPGDATAKAALGYLHSNCGICHNAQGKLYLTQVQLDLWAHLETPLTVETSPAYLSSACDQWPGDKFNPITSCGAGHNIGAPNQGTIAMVPNSRRIVPGNPMRSSIHELMNLRGDANSKRQMPPLASKLVDTAALAAIDAWINALPR